MDVPLWLVVSLVIATFNWNLGVFLRKYEGISTYHWTEWIFVGWGGRIVIGMLTFASLCKFLKGHYKVLIVDQLPPRAFLAICIVLLVSNLLWTAFEIFRDLRRLKIKNQSR